MAEEKKVELNTENLDNVAGGCHMPDKYTHTRKNMNEVINPNNAPEEKKDLADKSINVKIDVNQKQVKSSGKNCN